LKSHHIQPPRLLTWLVTNALLMAAAHYFFFPPLELYTDTAQRVSAAIQSNVHALVALF